MSAINPKTAAVSWAAAATFDEEPDGYLRFRRSLLRDAAYEGLPFKRPARPDEVADLVAFLASARASYISATVVTIDAGQSLRTRIN